MIDSMLDEVYEEQINGETQLAGWVHEDGFWSRRVLTKEEVDLITPMLERE